ncbi:MAG TPA: redoxin domain-containing protein, partial [Planctomycetota bacterium]|nr:redoxin domain-containing protein [Planctomycetota bacterium]
MRDSVADFEQLGVTVHGLAFDDVVTQAKFHSREKLNFSLLSDPDGSAAAKYGAAMDSRPFAKRVTYLIDEKGVLRAIIDKVNVGQHGPDLVARIRELQAGSEEGATPKSPSD